MVSAPQHETLNIEEQLARIAKMRIETDKLIQETRHATFRQMFFQGGAVMAGLIVAVATLINLFFT
jgi:hypothetical protein